MDKRLAGIPYVKVRVDDILISGKNDSDHLDNLESVLKKLDEAGLTVNGSKCAFLQDEVIYCGYRISKEGVRPMMSNVQAVLEAPQPKNVSELRSYLGMLNYYQNYLPDLATKTESLHQLLRKGSVWVWGKEQLISFNETKKMLCSAPILVHFNPQLAIVVHADASPYGVGAVLSHVMEDGSERPVCFASRTLSPAERNYGHIEKEGLALVFAVKKFHHYLFGHKFTMFTDHKPLLGLFAEDKGYPDRAAARILRWALLLSAYNYKLEYRKGISHGNADGLSRLPIEAELNDVSQSVSMINMMELVRAPVSEEDVQNGTKSDPLLSKVLSFVLNGWGNEVGSIEGLKPYFLRRTELTTVRGCVLWGNRVIIPEVLRCRVLAELHDCHTGASRMKNLARSFVWWPDMDSQIDRIAKGCSICCIQQNNPARAPIHSWQYPSGPWERIHVDYAGPFLGKMFFVVVDAYSKWIEVEVMNGSTAHATVKALRGMFAVHGLPFVLVSDNGPSFSGEEFRGFLRDNGIRHVFSAPYHPASNGQAERMVRILKETLRTMQRGDIETKLSRMLFKYRITPHSSTGYAPSELIFNRQLRSALQQLKPVEKGKGMLQSLEGENGEPLRKFDKGDLVWVRNFGRGHKWLKGQVVSKLGAVNYKVVLESGVLMHRHVNQVVQRVKDELVIESAIRDEIWEGASGNRQDVLDEGDILSEMGGVDDVGDVVGSSVDDGRPEIGLVVPRRSDRVRKEPAWLKDYMVGK